MKKFSLIFVCTMLVAVMSCICFAQNTAFEKNKAYTNQFSDVKQGDWFYQNVKDVYELGLMDGVSTDKFDTESTLTAAQGITISARLHSIYNGKEISEVQSPKKWYDKYVLYAIDNKIITQNEFSDYGKVLKSYQFVDLMTKALPDEYYPKINNVNEIPDITPALPYHDSVLTFYNAGILKGNDIYGTFYPESVLTRKRAAAIIGRIAMPNTREEFTLEEPKAVYTVPELEQIVISLTTPETLDEFTMVTIGNTAFSISDYMYFNTLYSDEFSGEQLKNKVLDQLKTRALVYKLSVEKNIPMSYAKLRQFYTGYYLLKYENGDKYSAILDLYGTTDRALCKDEMMYQFYSYMTNELFVKTHENLDLDTFINQNKYICTKHIFISNDFENALEEINAVYEKVSAGEDFDELVKQYSQDPTALSNPNGYYFKQDEMVKQFEDAAYALQPEQISNIIETEYGYYIIKRCRFNNEHFIASGAADAYILQKADEYYEKEQQKLKVVYDDSFDEFLKLAN